MWEVIVSKRMFGGDCREKGCGEKGCGEKGCGEKAVGKKMGCGDGGERDAGRGPWDRYVGRGLRGKVCGEGTEGIGMWGGD